MEFKLKQKIQQEKAQQFPPHQKKDYQNSTNSACPKKNSTPPKICTRLNELSLPQKEFYTTKDLYQALDLHPDTFRYRLRKGIYPEPNTMAGDKRRYTLNEIKELIKITEDFPQKKWKLRK
ncbi:MAG: hypothetical protein JRI71_16045 [Deltaproteobacteria bacterium]|nr:hypothetical protein [Deltaproteobacteria bacterium]